MSIEQFAKQGTPKLFNKSGGTSTTASPLLFTMAGLGAGAGATSQKIDFAFGDANALYAPLWGWELNVEWSSGTLPTAGGLIELFVAYSLDGSVWPTGVAGADGDLSVKTWLVRPYVERIGVLGVQNADTTHRGDGRFSPRKRFGQFIVWNGTDAAFEAEPADPIHQLKIWADRRYSA
jgi:hypothetical protein